MVEVFFGFDRVGDLGFGVEVDVLVALVEGGGCFVQLG